MLTGETPLQIGSIFASRYKIVGMIGSGGNSTVYKATNITINKYVAVKVLRTQTLDTDSLQERFNREAKVASSIKHPNLVGVYDFGLTPVPYLVMDFIDGKTLSAEIAARGCLTLNQALPIFCQLCDALAVLHKAGVVHRDVKPSNVMLSQGSHDETIVTLIDLGLAKVLVDENSLAGDLTKSGDFLGSLPYMSPEQYRSQPLDGRSDIYSLGCLMYETIAGQKAFQATDALAWMTSHLNRSPTPLAACAVRIPHLKRVEQVLLKTLEKSPDWRYKNIEELRQDLLLLSRNKKPLALKKRTPIGSKVRRISWRWSMRHTLLLGAAAMILLAIALSFCLVEREALCNWFWQREIASAEKSMQMANYAEAESKLKNASAISASFGALDSRSLSTNRLMFKLKRLSGDTRAADEIKKRLNELIGVKVSEKWQQLDWQAYEYAERGRLGDALASSKLALQEAERFGPINLSVAETLNNTSRMQFNAGQYDAAVESALRSLKIREQLLDKDDVQISSSLGSLARMKNYQKDYREAAALYRKAIAIIENQVENKSDELAEDLAVNYYALGGIYSAWNHLTEAEAAGRTAVKLSEHLNFSRPRGKLTRCLALSFLGDVCRRAGKLNEARALLTSAVELESGDEQRPGFAPRHVNLALLDLQQNRLTEAASEYKSAIDMLERERSANRPLIEDYKSYARVLRLLKRNRDSVAALKRAKELQSMIP